jgi:hypothetical protein
MSYDRADWHYGGKYPKGLPHESGGTHIGMFLAWAIINGLEGEDPQDDCPASLAAVRARQMTGRQFLFRECDEKFTEADLSEEGNAFAQHYHSSPEWHYLKDYERFMAVGLPSMYHVEDTWDNYDKIAALISQWFVEWRRTR